MREKHVGFLVVAQEPAATYGRPVGAVTDRDIVISVVAKGEDPKQLTDGDIMNEGPAARAHLRGDADRLHRFLR